MFSQLLNPRLLGFGLFLGLVHFATVLSAQTDVWQAQGSAPHREGQVENITNREVVGAVHAVAPHPTNANTLFIGSVNGGVWRSDDALVASPSWAALTDLQNSLSIGALEFDPGDTANQTLVAGIGRFSNMAGIGPLGGARTGILRTTDGGTTWTPLGQLALAGTNISGVAARGNIIVVSDSIGGVWRSKDTGVTWTRISGLFGSGLPAGASFDLEGVPGAPATLYTNAGNAIFQSTDTGATWAQISTPAMNAFFYSNVRISTLAGNTVYVAIANGGILGGVFQSTDAGVNWTAMGVPLTNEGAAGIIGIHFGGQAGTNLSMVADPNVAGGNVIYLGGDRQPGPFPNSIGAQNFTGRLFRGTVTAAAATQYAHLTHSNSAGAAGGGTANNSSPHADSRNMEVDAAGNLIEVSDGGVYRRNLPASNQGIWTSANGNLQNTEFHSVAWDAVSNRIIGGAQDVGTPEQRDIGSLVWRDITQADGGAVAVDDISTPGVSTRYFSSQNLGGFSQRMYDADNNMLAQSPVALTVLSGGAAIIPQFYTPVVVNNNTGTRLIVGANSVYESLDGGATVTEIGVGIVANSALQGEAIAYGAADNANMLYVGSGTQVFVRPGAHPASLLAASAALGTQNIVDVAIDPDTAQSAYAVDQANVYQTTDGGANWANITGDLVTGFNPGLIRSVDVFSVADQNAVIVGTDRGVYWADALPSTDWSPLCRGLPNAPVIDLEFDEQDEVLLAGTLGRGAWTCAPAQARETEYRVKFVCGRAQGDVLAPGTYTTAINIINLDAPGASPGSYRRSFSIGLPGEEVGGTSAPGKGPSLAPGEAVEIDCDDILREIRMFCPDGLCKGFASIDSAVPLDIVAVYSVEDPSTNAVTDLTTEKTAADTRQCAETTLTIPASTRLFVPPHRQGDREFDGNGPCVRFAIDLHEVDDGTALEAMYSMHAFECSGSFTSPQDDFTAAEGTRSEIIASAGPGGRILGYSTDGLLTHSYIDNDHADDDFPFVGNEPVSNLRFVGDTGGDESGTETSVMLTYRPIDVRMKTCSIPSDAG